MRIGPVAFLILVPAIWTGVRALMLWPSEEKMPAKTIAWAEPLDRGGVASPASGPSPLVPSEVEGRFAIGLSASAPRLRAARYGRDERPPQELALAHPDQGRNPPPSSPARTPLSISPEPRSPPTSKRNRFSLSAWLLARGEVAPGLAAAGQLGGSQAGVRVRYAMSDHVHLAARLSGPLQSRLGKEAALALDVRPVASVPITLMVERRIGLDRGGRDAFGIGAFGGFDRELAPRLRLDGYAQAGVVGLKRRDPYVDGALRAERELLRGPGLRVGFGAGAWGGAQPGAARLDVGPQLVARLSGVRLGAEWRQRVAGNAKPGSGPVLSLGADF
jgi:hypothetical protein